MKTIVFVQLSFALVGCLIEPRTETSPKAYSSLLTNWTPTGLVAHFPSSLPPTATKIKLSAFPGFLQGGAWFQVSLTLPAADVSRAFDDATRNAKDFYDGGGFFTSTNSKEGGLPGTTFHVSNTPQRTDFPADYRIFVFAAQSSSSNSWNHGASHGVVISKQRNEIIYYAENW